MKDSVHMVKAAYKALLDRNCADPAIFEVSSYVGYTDYILVATGRSGRQIRSIADEVEKQVSEVGERVIGVEGKENSEWILLDFGAMVVHLFQEESRAYYQMDALWSSYRVDPETL